ncbi:hypothetical protein NDU88_005892 [Pleurodeles waltl]|uniref:Uncharacterized protein n=1 Tax=Pleurodeles waltl TaxID=8319 RepID=A0AAV7VNA8_PLEWA|nr:hypothetical protein NDU88_005892 [Pleurodeles waltl]
MEELEKSKDEKKTKEDQCKDEKQTRGEHCHDKKQMTRAARRKKTVSEKSGSKQSPWTLLEKPTHAPWFWRTVALVVSDPGWKMGGGREAREHYLNKDFCARYG